jgi:phosphoribosylformylglycinamidine (FGAM) synthase PurS component
MLTTPHSMTYRGARSYNMMKVCLLVMRKRKADKELSALTNKLLNNTDGTVDEF